jgi:hypothetical protein
LEPVDDSIPFPFEPFPINFSELPADSEAQIVLLQVEDNLIKQSYLYNFVDLTTNSEGQLQSVPVGFAPTMPTGNYIFVACALDDCSTQSIIENYDSPAIKVQQRTIAERLNEVTITPVFLQGASDVTYLGIDLGDANLTSEDQLDFIVRRQDVTDIQEDFRISDTPLSEFVLGSPHIDEANARAIVSPSTLVNVAPALAASLAETQPGSIQSLAPGEYQVDVLLNGVLEASAEVVVE